MRILEKTQNEFGKKLVVAVEEPANLGEKARTSAARKMAEAAKAPTEAVIALEATQRSLAITGNLPLGESFTLAVLCRDYDQNHRKGDCKTPYSYTESQLALQGECAGFTFTLPKTPYDLIKANTQLKGGSLRFLNTTARAEEVSVLIVSNAEGQTVGLVNLIDKTATSAQGAKVSSLRNSNPEAFAAFERWVETNGIEYHRNNRMATRRQKR